eukprot:9423633-Alexandrium_andersonii.AAC.1
MAITTFSSCEHVPPARFSLRFARIAAQGPICFPLVCFVAARMSLQFQSANCVGASCTTLPGHGLGAPTGSFLSTSAAQCTLRTTTEAFN